MKQPVVSLKNVSKNYVLPSGAFCALRDISLDIYQGESIALVGRSGSGKSTLLNLMAGIDTPSRGEIHAAGAAVHRLDEETSAAWRGRKVGIVFQFFQLMPTLTIVENVMLPMDFCNSFPVRERRARAMSLLEKLGIASQADKLPAALSGGQQQRAAIARALANDPPLIVADEPTGNLDSQTSREVIELFTSLSAEGKTVVIATHDWRLKQRFSRTVALEDGRVLCDKESMNADAA
ncbi:MAG: transporter ATP-binding protein [Paucimonas sp.]|jgi:putative ABC transport system ATP-binding protein|nr:transporter ATP-binding protein [Paucimonas sp.]